LKNIAIRNLSDETYRGLQLRAKAKGWSTEAEIREILEAAALPEGRDMLGHALVAVGRAYGGLDLGVLKKEQKSDSA